MNDRVQENFRIAITSVTSPGVVRNGTTQMALKFFAVTVLAGRHHSGSLKWMNWIRQ